jgi:glyoxylase I family protein
MKRGRLASGISTHHPAPRMALAIRENCTFHVNMSIRAVAHVCLKTPDLVATERFYTDILGFERQFYFTRRGQIIGFYLRIADRVFLEAFSERDPPPSDASRTLSHFCLETDDIKALHAKLLKAGFEPSPVKIGADATLQFWVKDPNDVAIEIQQYTNESAQFRHENVEVNW